MIPQIFAGDRKDAERFMQQFGAYRFLNRHNSTFMNKAEMVAYALTFIKGLQADNWAYDMADQLSIKVEGNPVMGDPQHMLKETKPSGTGSHDPSEMLSQIQPGSKTPTPASLKWN
jgi:hypothetical protein